MRFLRDSQLHSPSRFGGQAKTREPPLLQMRTQGNTATFGDVTISLAKAYGFCWGVERAVQMAYEARTQFPGAKLYMTNEIIHNPGVNAVCTPSSAYRKRFHTVGILYSVLLPVGSQCCGDDTWWSAETG